MPFGILIRLVHALQHGTVNLLFGQFKEHCFYEPVAGTCESVYIG